MRLSRASGLLVLALLGCQTDPQQQRPVALDEALRTTAQMRLGRETADQPGGEQPGTPAGALWNQAEGGEQEIDLGEIADGTPLAQARAVYRSVMRNRAQMSLPQRIRELDRARELIETNYSKAAETLAGDIHLELGLAYSAVDNLRSASAELKTATGLFEKVRRNDRRHLTALHYGGTYAASVRDFDTAETMLARARVLVAHLSRDRDAEKWAPLYRGRVAAIEAWLNHMRGNHAVAADRYRVAIAAFTETGSYRGDIAALYARQALSLRALGRLFESEASTLESIRLYTDLNGRDNSYVVGQLRTLAGTLYQQGRHADRERVMADAVGILERLGRDDESLELARSRALHAAALFNIGRGREALPLFDKAFATFRRVIPDRVYGEVYASYTQLLAGARRREEALRYSEGALEYTKATYGPDSFNAAVSRGYRGTVLNVLGEHAAAVSEIRAAASRLFAADDDVTADDESGATGRDSDRRSIGTAFLFSAAHLAEQAVTERDALARETFQMAERMRQGGTARALAAAAERQAIRDPAVADLLRREQNAGLEQARLLRRIAEISSQRAADRNAGEMAAARQRVEQLEMARKALREEIARRDPSLAQRRSTLASTIDQTRAALRDDEAMVSLFTSAGNVYLWAFRRQGPVAFVRVAMPASERTDIIARIRKPMDTPVTELADIPAFDTAAAHEMYRRLLEPVRPIWGEASTLIVVPHGSLSQLPFQLLVTEPVAVGQDRQALFDRYATVQFLAKTAAVAQMPSATSLVQLRAQKAATPAREAFVGFGDPLFNTRQAAQAANAMQSRGARLTLRSVRSTEDGKPLESIELRSRLLGGLARLPETADEVRSVAAALGADPARDVFLGMAANEARVRSMDLSNKRVVMFATHGLLAGDLPGLTQPALALTSPDVAKIEGDGLLTLDNIMGLRLNADWVVLSACNTAGGDGANAEAISGLGRAFFFAGTRALLVTNWAVETSSAQALTTTLFREQAQASRGEALRRTMVGMIERGVFVSPSSGRPLFSYAHPLFWAPYSLVGDPGSGQPGT